MLRPGGTQKHWWVGKLRSSGRPGDQVKAGDLLITLISANSRQILKPLVPLEQAEAAVEKLSAARTEQAEAAQKAITDLQRQLERLSSAGGTARTLGEMLTQNPSF